MGAPNHNVNSGWLIGIGLKASLAFCLQATEPQILHIQATPAEPVAVAMSLARAAESMDAAAWAWQAENRCSQCHANMLHLIARPLLGPPTTVTSEVRELYEWLVREKWEDKGLRYPAEATVVAVPLAFNDAQTSGKLHPLTRRALDRMLALQRLDGSWQWVIGAPKAFVREFELTMFAALGIAVAPDDYASQPEPQRVLTRVGNWVRTHPPTTAHAKGMLLWASKHIPGLATEAERREMSEALMSLQGADGGWAAENLAAGAVSFEGARVDQARVSDGYGTGYAIFQIRNGGISAADPRIQRGVTWLMSNQRQSGRWFTGSFNKRPNHVLSNSGTAYAVLALASCGLIP